MTVDSEAAAVPRKRFAIRGASFEAPRAWVQENILTLTLPGPRPRPTMTLTRRPLAEGETPTTLLSRAVTAYAPILAMMQVRQSGAVALPGVTGQQVRLVFEELEGRMVMRVLVAELPGVGGVVTLTGRALAEGEATLDAAFDLVAASLAPAPLRAGSSDRGGGPSPMRFEYEGMTIVTPPGWEEETMAVVGPLGRSPRPTLTLTRIGSPPGTNLDTVIARFVTELATTVPAVLLETARTHVGRLVGTAVLIGYLSEVEGATEDEMVVQRLVFVRGSGATWVLAGAASTRGARSMNADLVHAQATLTLPTLDEMRA